MLVPAGGRRAVRRPARAHRPGRRRSIFISHKLDEVLGVADAITVIRAGRTVAEIDDVATVTARQLAELMVGSELPTPETRYSTVTDEVALAVDGLTVAGADGGRPLVDDVSFRVHRGEIVGIAGVEGNGQSELIGGAARHRGAGRRPHRDRRPATPPPRHQGPAGRRPRLHPRGPPARRPGADGAAVGERRARPPGAARRSPAAFWIDRKGARKRTEEIIDALRRAHARARRGRLRPVGRQPAEAHRRPGDDGRAHACCSPPTRPAASTSAPRPRCGTS